MTLYNDSKEKHRGNKGKHHEESHHDKETLAPIKSINLPDSVAGGRGANTVVSVLDPVIRVERGQRDESGNGPQDYYRIVLTFKLQVKIHSFEKGYMRRYNKLFDFISLRYLYRDGEEHEIKPGADQMANDIEVTKESTHSSSFEAQLSPGEIPTMPLAPSASVHVQKDDTLTVHRKMKSWRSGLSYEGYSRKKVRENHHQWKGRHRVNKHLRHRAFEICTKHIPHCNCPAWSRHHGGHHEPYKEGDTGKKWIRCCQDYKRCAHWFWQTEAQPHVWTPEIYESITLPITVTRIEAVDTIEKKKTEGDVHKYLHFDFALKSRLRELGWKYRDHFDLLRRRLKKPAEIRAQDDYGFPMAAEKVKFCVWCCEKEVGWPDKITRNKDMEGEEEYKKHGSLVPCRLPSDRVREMRRNRERGEERLQRAKAMLETVKLCRELSTERERLRVPRTPGGCTPRPQSLNEGCTHYVRECYPEGTHNAPCGEHEALPAAHKFGQHVCCHCCQDRADDHVREVHDCLHCSLRRGGRDVEPKAKHKSPCPHCHGIAISETESSSASTVIRKLRHTRRHRSGVGRPRSMSGANGAREERLDAESFQKSNRRVTSRSVSQQRHSTDLHSESDVYDCSHEERTCRSTLKCTGMQCHLCETPDPGEGYDASDESAGGPEECEVSDELNKIIDELKASIGSGQSSHKGEDARRRRRTGRSDSD